MTEDPGQLPQLSGPMPTQLLRVDPHGVTALLAGSPEDRRFQQVRCDPVLTNPGDRIAIYEEGSKRGIVAVADVHSRPSGKGEVSAAWAVVQELDSPVSRAAIDSAGLASARRQAKPVRDLSESEQLLLAEQLDPLPPFVTNSAPVPEEDAALHRFPVEVGDDELWGSEREMQLAIAANEDAVRDLGLEFPPRIEERFRGHQHRFDLSSDEVIVECKLFASLESLGQLRGYLNARAEDNPEIAQRGHLVAAFGYTRDLAVALDRMDDETGGNGPPISLWNSVKRPDGTPVLLRHSHQEIPEVTFRKEVHSQLLSFVAAHAAVWVQATDLARDAGLTDEEIDEIVEEGQGNGSDLDPVDETDAASALRGVEQGMDLGIEGVCQMAAAAGVPEAMIDGVGRLVLPHVVDREEESPVDSLALALSTNENMAGGLFPYGYVCALDWGDMSRLALMATDDDFPENMSTESELGTGFVNARFALGWTSECLIFLARMAGFTEDEFQEAFQDTAWDPTLELPGDEEGP